MWTKKDINYNKQCNEVEFYYDHDRTMFDVLDNKTLDIVLLYFGAGKYESNENFLLRRERIIARFPNIENKAIAAMNIVTTITGNDNSLWVIE